ncbi:transglycosylase domain-containing protein [Petrotoga olearia]|nr:transglycosylase domain-containing protein [Petrotoga olearia]
MFFIKSFIIGFFTGMAIFFALFFYIYDYYNNSTSIFLVDPRYNTYLFDNGEQILSTKYKYVKLDEIPPELIYFLLWTEDREFYEHNGINIKAMTRAALTNIKNFSIVQGGSTLTQQLAKTVYLTNERTIKRKIMDIMLSFFLERSYTKEEILEAYVNSVYLGNDISGFGAAAKRYYGKDLQSLSYEEMLVLIGIINGPEVYNPYKYPERAKNQGMIVLNSLPNNFIIEGKDILTGKIDKMVFYPQTYDERYLNLIYRIKAEEENIGLKGGGYTIKTTFNKNLFDSVTVNSSTSAIVINNKTGEILSFWGGEYDVFYSQQQVGSAIKPFYYLLALENGYDKDTTLPDQPMKFGDWAPENFDKTYRGTVTLEEALVDSINIPSIYLASHIDISPQRSIETIKNFLSNIVGVQGKYPNDLTLALGTLETSPYEFTKAYSIFPNYGLIPSPYIITEVYDKKGNLIYKRHPNIERKIEDISNDSYAAMNTLMRKVVLEGTGQRANVLDLDLHGKTGTSDLSAWFVGYTGSEVLTSMVKGEDLLSSYTAVPLAREIATSLLYYGQSEEVYVYLSLKSIQESISFFESPIDFVSTGGNVVGYLNSVKLDYPFKELEKNINSALREIQYLYPDVMKEIEQWKKENLMDFFQDPFSFIQNGYDLESYLNSITIDKDTQEKLMEIYNQIKYIYPDQSKIIEKILE